MLEMVTAGLRLASLIGVAAAALATAPVAAGQPPLTPISTSAAAVQAQLDRIDREIARGPFRPDWQSLAGYRIPDWYRDAKFGIFVHWGVYSVPAFGSEWYSRNMYVPGNPAFTYQRAVYGDQSSHGYKDFIAQFRGEKFDPAAWVALFKRAGARYVVPVAEHCDGFAMYDSAITRWNAAKMGPKRDVVGEVAAATRAAGLHFGLSSHRAEHWWWYGQAPADSDVWNPAYADLYGPAAPRTLAGVDPAAEPDPNHLEQWLPPSKAFLDDWLARTGEAIEKYQPEFVYLDWWINQPAFAPYLQRLAAYYYDDAAQKGFGPVLTYKEEAFAPGTAVFDIERGRLDALRLLPWQTDTSVSVNSWGYVQDDHYRTASSLIATLVDVVSKNGNLLLNVGPKADGTIPAPIVTVLGQMGNWLAVNGEAIYGSRPWVMFGEGPTRNAVGSLQEGGDPRYTPADIRFTTQGSTLYAMGLARPADGQALIRTLYRGNPYAGPVASVRLLGSDAAVRWTQQVDGLHVALPATGGDAAMPYTLRIEFGARSGVAAGATS
jgi:alpha-L-fucosidase